MSALTNRQEQIVVDSSILDAEPYTIYRKNFLEGFGWKNCDLTPLPAHASYRKYYRITGGSRPALLMDATLDVTEPLIWYITIDKHLRDMGLNAPEVIEHEITDDYSLALIEDWGDDTYDSLIDKGEDTIPLYEKAIDVLAYIHNHDKACDVDVSQYTIERMIFEAMNLVNWYAPAATGDAICEQEVEDYKNIWNSILMNMPPIKDSLVLFDYIFNNMMRVKKYDDSDIKSLGLLDFQAARIGPAIYDVVSLLEDIRRDLSEDNFLILKNRYLTKVKITDSEEYFDLWFSVMTMQRHCKNMGNLVRLFVRDGKPELLQYIPRMRSFMQKHIDKPVFKDLKEWFKRNNIDLTKDLQEGFENADGYPTV